MVNKVTFVGFRAGDRPPWIRPWSEVVVIDMSATSECLLVFRVPFSFFFLRRSCAFFKLLRADQWSTSANRSRTTSWTTSATAWSWRPNPVALAQPGDLQQLAARRHPLTGKLLMLCLIVALISSWTHSPDRLLSSPHNIFNWCFAENFSSSLALWSTVKILSSRKMFVLLFVLFSLLYKLVLFY